MPTIKAKDGAEIFYKDWGTGTPVVFSHGWPLNADAWDPQMMFLGSKGYRVIAHDRRGHGRSAQTWEGNEMDTYADDLAVLFEALDLKDATMIGHSTGGGEVAHYLGRHGSSRVQKAILIGAVPPIMLKSETNPGGLPIEVFDGIRAGTLGDRSQYFKELAVPFYGYNKPDAKISQGVIDNFWYQGMQGGIKALYDCVKAFSETDFNADLKSIKIPVLFLHGDADQIVPIDDAAKIGHTLVPGSKLVILPGKPHGMCTVASDEVNAEILKFIQE